MEALNPKYTNKINRLYKLHCQYENLLDEHLRVWDTEDEYSASGYRKKERQDRKEEKLFNRLFLIKEKLPKKECLNFNKQYVKLTGHISII